MAGTDLLEHRVRILEKWHAAWVTLVLLAVVAGAGWMMLDRALQSLRTLRCSRTEDGVRLHSTKDGPFVVTHLYYAAAGSPPGHRVARLREPIAIIDSYGARIDNEELAKLSWRDFQGQPVAAPPEGAALSAWYYIPEVTRRPGERGH